LTSRRGTPYNERVGKRAIAAVLTLASLVACAAYAADARTTLERFLARATSTPLNDLTLDLDLYLFSPDGRAPYATGSQYIVIKMPDRQRVEQSIDGRNEVRLTVGNKSWRRGPDGKVEALPAQRSQSIVLAVPVHRKADDVLQEWRALGVRDDRSHESRLGGRPVLVVGAMFGERDRPAAWLDDEYGVVRFVGRDGTESGNVLTDVSFSDHRPLIGRIFFPYRQEVFRSGRLLMRVLVRSAKVNTSPADTLFDPASLRAAR
jgi:hypothetical protein